jgi:hypothetical protein
VYTLSGTQSGSFTDLGTSQETGASRTAFSWAYWIQTTATTLQSITYSDNKGPDTSDAAMAAFVAIKLGSAAASGVFPFRLKRRIFIPVGYSR